MTAAQCRCGGNSRANVANGGWREGVLGVWPVLPSRLQQHGLRPLQESVKAPGGPPFPPLPWPRAVLPPRLNGAEEGVLPGGCPPTGVLPRPLDASPPVTRPLDAPRPPSLADTWAPRPRVERTLQHTSLSLLGIRIQDPKKRPVLGIRINLFTQRDAIHTRGQARRDIGRVLAPTQRRASPAARGGGGRGGTGCCLASAGVRGGPWDGRADPAVTGTRTVGCGGRVA